EEIAAEFQCDRSIVSKILKQKQWSDVHEVSKNANALKTNGPKFSQIEQALGMWIGAAKQRQLILTEEVICQKVLEFAALLEVSKNGTEKIKLLVINKSCIPLEFRHEGITSHNQLPVNYYYNEKVWMQRRILLLVNNATSHKVDNLEDYPNISHYKRLYINQVIHDFDRGVEEPSKIDILQNGQENKLIITNLFLGNMVSESCMGSYKHRNLKNCWCHTGILPQQHLVKVFPGLELAPNEDPEAQIIQIPKIITAQHEAQEVIDLTEDTNLQQLTQDYLDDDEPINTEEVLDDEQIIEFVKNPVVNDNKSDEQVDEEPKITFAEAKSSLNQLLTFIRQQSF
ncbi:8595_t:CDS:2, partial [Gigaspora margarita]